MKLKEIAAAIEMIAPLALQENYDNSGLIVGNNEMEVTQALLCLDATEEVIDEAISTQCNLVVAHHPIIFSGLRKITGKTYVERVIAKAIKNDIAIYAVHTNLDNIEKGVNEKICNRIGVKNTRILLPVNHSLMKLFTFVPPEHAEKVRQALFAAGSGSIGDYDECSFNVEGYGTFRPGQDASPFVGEKGKQHREKEIRVEVIFPGWLKNNVVRALKENHPYEEVAYDVVSLQNTWQQVGAGMIGELEMPMPALDFFRFLKQKMKVSIIRHTKLDIKDSSVHTISHVAVCGGAGSFLLPEAIRAGADIFVTSDFKYHQFFDTEGQIIIADIGHYESEQFTPEIFAEVLRQKFPTFAVRFTSVNTNPINYF